MGDASTLDTLRRPGPVRVVAVTGRRRLVHRLAALGVVPGTTMTVIRPRCPALIAIGGARIAIGRSAARAVEVEEAGS